MEIWNVSRKYVWLHYEKSNKIKLKLSIDAELMILSSIARFLSGINRQDKLLAWGHRKKGGAQSKAHGVSTVAAKAITYCVGVYWFVSTPKLCTSFSILYYFSYWFGLHKYAITSQSFIRNVHESCDKRTINNHMRWITDVFQQYPKFWNSPFAQYYHQMQLNSRCDSIFC